MWVSHASFIIATISLCCCINFSRVSSDILTLFYIFLHVCTGPYRLMFKMSGDSVRIVRTLLFMHGFSEVCTSGVYCYNIHEELFLV